MPGPIRKFDVTPIKNQVVDYSARKKSETKNNRVQLSSQVEGYMGSQTPGEGPNSFWQNKLDRIVLPLNKVLEDHAVTKKKFFIPLKNRLKNIKKNIVNQLGFGKKQNVEIQDFRLDDQSVSVTERCRILFASSPATINDILSVIDELKKHRDHLKNVTINDGDLSYENTTRLIEQINVYLRVLEARKENVITYESLLRLKIEKIEIVKTYFSDFKTQGVSDENLEFFIEWLSKYQRGLSNELQSSSLCNHIVSEKDKKSVKNMFNKMAEIGQRLNLKVKAEDLLKKEVSLLESSKVSEINKEIQIYKDGSFYEFQQRSVPAALLQSDSTVEGACDMFPKDYNGKFITSFSKTNSEHAMNLFVNKLCIKEEGETPIVQIVRHGILSPYGLPTDSAERKQGAINRVEEVVIASLSTKPEILKAAMKGQEPSLTLVSTSLVTPDRIRKYLGEQGEREMIGDQIAAYNLVQNNKPLKLQMKLPNGQFKSIKLNVNIIPFNFGVNDFAVHPQLNTFAGWAVSDHINDTSLPLLLGPMFQNEVGGLVGEFLHQYPDHPKNQIIIELVKQIKEIYINKAHRLNQGGAYKLNSRISVLAEYLGYVPTINCKSGKDRTSLAIAVTEALFVEILLNKKVPDWKSVDQSTQYLVREFAMQGGHHDIQKLNTGVLGFKCQNIVLNEYMPNIHVQDFIKGFAV